MNNATKINALPIDKDLINMKRSDSLIPLVGQKLIPLVGEDVIL